MSIFDLFKKKEIVKEEETEVFFKCYACKKKTSNMIAGYKPTHTYLLSCEKCGALNQVSQFK